MRQKRQAMKYAGPSTWASGVPGTLDRSKRKLPADMLPESQTATKRQKDDRMPITS